MHGSTAILGEFSSTYTVSLHGDVEVHTMRTRTLSGQPRYRRLRRLVRRLLQHLAVRTTSRPHMQRAGRETLVLVVDRLIVFPWFCDENSTPASYALALTFSLYHLSPLSPSLILCGASGVVETIKHQLEASHITMTR